MKQLSIKAYAKINLFLNIKGIRDDGYHELEMVMQSINLYDNIKISSRKKGINIETNSNEIPVGKDNLVYKAAQKIMGKTNFPKGVSIFIDKNIPVAAGLAGGSTDAAAVIKGMNEFFNLNLEKDTLHDIARQVGSDVPFCLNPGTAYATGRGDELKYLSPIKTYKVILVKPPVMVSTKKIYEMYDKSNYNIEIPVKKLLETIKNQRPLNIKDGWANVLEPVTKNIVKDVEKIENILKNKGFDFTLMTGSGPTVFSLVDKSRKELIEKTIKNWQREQDFITLAETI
ncbi:MAG: 4-(cytidine 5'-diphospho)-2-C-methyl-D-erythritol kinase [Halanaerobiales bacterium]|nr:4-(cytidine 5'-diphospho)-2-C-methyl-D-erythritol kinase [Halanaerobiales bacterium]